MNISGGMIIFLILTGVVGLVMGAISGYLFSERKKPVLQKRGIFGGMKLVEIAVLWREQNGKLIIEADNKYNHHLDGFSPEKVQEIVKVFGELFPASPKEVINESQSDKKKSHPGEKLEIQTLQTFEGKPIFADSLIAKNLGSTTKKSSEEKKDTHISIVMQIDNILQKLLVDSKMKNRLIRLGEDPAQGVVVWIGMQRFNGIAEVPDLEIQEIIHKAVAQWENSEGEK
jgi:hypothetical protein